MGPAALTGRRPASVLTSGCGPVTADLGTMQAGGRGGPSFNTFVGAKIDIQWVFSLHSAGLWHNVESSARRF